jgi:glutaminase
MFNRKWAEKLLLAATIIVPSSLPMLAQAQASRSPLAPRREVVAAVVQDAYDKFKNETRGKKADYIPYLAQVDSKLFGIAIVTTDNQVLTMGDVKYSISIQSISKVYTLALAMEALGADKVFEKVGSEPTGRPFNSPVAVVDMPTHTGNPFC